VPPTAGARRTRKTAPDAAADGVGDLAATNRWGLRGKKGKSMQDNPLISGFGRLRQELAGVKGMCLSWVEMYGGQEMLTENRQTSTGSTRSSSSTRSSRSSRPRAQPPPLRSSR
jgi:hypothetical protein